MANQSAAGNEDGARALRAIDHLQKGEDVSVEGAALKTNESDSDGDELDILKDARSDEGDLPMHDLSYGPGEEGRTEEEAKEK